MVRSTNDTVCFLVLGLGLLAAAPSAEAADISWRNPNGGTFSNAASWFGSVVPSAGDVAHFGLNSGPFEPFPYTVSFTLDATNQRLVVEDDSVIFDLNGRVYRTPTSGNQIGTVAGRTGRLAVVDGLWDDTGTGSLSIGTTGFLTISTGGQFVGKSINVDGTLAVQNFGQVESTFIIASGTVSVTGANASIVTAALSVGAQHAGALTINAGSQFQNSGGALVGEFSEGVGTINIDGANSSWTNTGSVEFGRRGEAIVNITGGGHATLGTAFIGSGTPAGTGTGKVTVSGFGSQLSSSSLLIGFIGDGELDVSAGGLVRSTGTLLEIGKEGVGEVSIAGGGRLEAIDCRLGGLNGLGTVSVAGAGSQWINSGTLKVGEFARGALSITDGGVVQNVNGFLGAGVPASPDTSNATVDGLDSQWINQGDLSVGNKKNGTLTISNRGRVSSVNGYVGKLVVNEAGIDGRGVGVVTVDGAGSEWFNSGVLAVGESGTGTLNITAGGLVRSQNAVVGQFSGSTGAVTVDGTGSLWFTTLGISIGNGGDGVVTVANGGVIRALSVAVDSLGSLSGNGTIIGNLSNNGLVAPGTSIGTLQVNGAYVQHPGGVLEIEIGGASGTHVDLLSVGAATLDGELSLRLIGGLVPLVNVALTATSLSGQFDNVISGQRLSVIDGGGSFLVHYGPGSPFNPNQITLSEFLPSISGDFDHDGDVDGNDFLVWQRGGSPTPLSNLDLAAWKTNFGAGGVTATSGAVPEPSSAWLAIAALSLAGACRSSRTMAWL